MKTVLIAASLLGAWSWLQPGGTRAARAWPAALPAFAGVRDVAFTTTLRGGTAFVHATVPAPADAVLEDARRAYAEAGWSVSPVRAHDMLVFTRGEAVATVLAQDTPHGTRIAVLQRPRGL